MRPIQSSTNLASCGEAAHEGLAPGQLRQTDVLVGLMRLFDAAWTAHHGRNAGTLEEARLGPEGHLREPALAGQALGHPSDRVLRRAEEAGYLAQRLEPEP